MREHGLTCVARHPNDEPQIVESWLAVIESQLSIATVT